MLHKESPNGDKLLQWRQCLAEDLEGMQGLCPEEKKEAFSLFQTTITAFFDELESGYYADHPAALGAMGKAMRGLPDLRVAANRLCRTKEEKETVFGNFNVIAITVRSAVNEYYGVDQQEREKRRGTELAIQKIRRKVGGILGNLTQSPSPGVGVLGMNRKNIAEKERKYYILGMEPPEKQDKA